MSTARKLLSILPSLRGMGQRIKESRDYRLIANSGLFDQEFYLSAYPDVARTDADPLLHYVLHGSQEGRNPSAAFNTKRYRHRHHLSANHNPLVHHILRRSRRKIGQLPGLDNIVAWRLEPDDFDLVQVPPSTDIGIFIHLYYEDLAREILDRLRNIPYRYRIYISTDTDAKRQVIESVLADMSLGERAIIKVLPNRGWDIGPFLVGFANEIASHEICLRLHGKKSTSQDPTYGARWRNHLFSELMGHPLLVSRIVSLFAANKDLGVVIPGHWDGIRQWLNIGSNFGAMRGVLARLNIQILQDQQIEFASGSMYWFRSRALAPLFDLKLDWKDFAVTDESKRDATIAHGIERSLLFCAAKAGFRWAFAPGQQMLADLTEEESSRILRRSGEFDSAYYLKRYPDIADSNWDPLEHYVRHGWRDDRDPSPNFNTRYYKSLIAGVGYGETNPLLHYVIIGREQGLQPKRDSALPMAIVVDDLYRAYKSAESAPTYVRETVPVIRKTTLKPIAFYLPQFHPFEENNRFWGRGFTEWTNTTKALPMFEGHYQPRLPGELGFYDTRVRDVLARQMELARQYGIHGFCLHHYFFDGKPVMRAPYDHILADKSLDLPFCLHWANEPWTARWDGEARMEGMLLEQRHSPEDDIAFFKDIQPAITDPRYITVDGRPLLLIYRPGLFPDIRATIERWRACCRAVGLPDLFLATMQTIFDGSVDPREHGFDAAVEFPPHNLPLMDVTSTVKLYDPVFEGNIFDYPDTMKKALAREKPPYTFFRGIMPDWDCTPRRANPGLFINTDPSVYGAWLEEICRQTLERLPPSRQFVFINAWNEWAEGAYLEPDRKYGYAYLHATADALNRAAATPADGVKQGEQQGRPDDRQMVHVTGSGAYHSISSAGEPTA